MRTEGLVRTEKENVVTVNSMFGPVNVVPPKQSYSCFYEWGIDRDIEIVGFRDDDEPEFINELSRRVIG